MAANEWRDLVFAPRGTTDEKNLDEKKLDEKKFGRKNSDEKKIGGKARPLRGQGTGNGDS